MITLLTPQDADFPGNPPPQESFLQAHFFKMLWCLWGLVMALLVGWLDRDVASALCWSAAAIMIGTVGSSIANRILGPYLQWFERFDRDEPLIRRLARMKSEDLEGENYKLQLEGYSDVHLRIAIPPLFGVFHGLLFGGAIGVFGGWQFEWETSASQNAFIGLAIGLIVITLNAMLTMALLIPLPKQLSTRQKWQARLLILASPMFVIPASSSALMKIARPRTYCDG